MDLKNPWNDNKPVKISRDGQVRLMFVGIVIQCYIFGTCKYHIDRSDAEASTKNVFILSLLAVVTILE